MLDKTGCEAAKTAGLVSCHPNIEDTRHFRYLAVRLPSFQKDAGSFRLTEVERPNRLASDKHDRHGLFQYRGLHRTGDGLFSQVHPGLRRTGWKPFRLRGGRRLHGETPLESSLKVHR